MEIKCVPALTDEFDLLYIRRRNGWSDLRIVAKDVDFTATISHTFSDPIADLAEFCGSLLEGRSPCFVRLYDEPGAMAIKAWIYSEQKHIARFEIWDGLEWEQLPPDGHLVFSVDLKIQQFVGLVFRQLDKVRWLYREKSFQRDRDEFPSAPFEALEQLLSLYSSSA